jgi:hypothetical protein
MSAQTRDEFQYCQDFIIRSCGIDDPLHKPEKRGILALVRDLETSVGGCASSGHGHALFVLRKDDIEAILGLQKIVAWAQSQVKGSAR